MINYDNLKNDIENLIKESSASISVTFCDLDNDEKFSINGNKKVPSASMIKLLIMLTLLKLSLIHI